ncbi:MAG: NADH-quinone oxidoreductase subunit C [bacterium]
MSGRSYEAGFLSHDIRMVTGANAIYEDEAKNIIVNTGREALTFLLDFLFTKWGFNYLLLIMCREESDEYKLTYVLSSRKILVPVIVRTSVLKSTPVFTTIGMIYKSAFQYEEEIYRNFGIVFEGNPYTVSYYVKNILSEEKEDE